jgi:hypothetical protein
VATASAPASPPSPVYTAPTQPAYTPPQTVAPQPVIPQVPVHPPSGGDGFGSVP